MMCVWVERAAHKAGELQSTHSPSGSGWANPHPELPPSHSTDNTGDRAGLHQPSPDYVQGLTEVHEALRVGAPLSESSLHEG